MILLENGRKKTGLLSIVKNNTIECALFSIMFVFEISCFVYEGVEETVSGAISFYLTEYRVSLIPNIMAIFIGIYITILTCIALSKISITEVILKNRLDEKIIAVVTFGVVEDFILLIFGVFIPIESTYIQIFFCFLLLTAVFSFGRFVRYVYLIFSLNIDVMVQEIDQENRERSDLFVKIDEILERIKRADRK